MNYGHPSEPVPAFPIEKLSLERVKIATVEVLSAEQLGSLSNTLRADIEERVGRSLAIRMSGYVWGLPSERIRVSEKWPADWWQTVKERWFPRWALRRWPVEYKSIEIDRQLFSAVYTNLQVPSDRPTYVCMGGES